MTLIDYVTEHTESLQSVEKTKENTADLMFFKVKEINSPDIEEFKRLAKEKFPHWFDGKEHSYLEIGGDIGDQGLALMTMGLGNLLGVWKLLTPENMVPFLNEKLKMKMAGLGYVSIKVKKEEK